MLSIGCWTFMSVLSLYQASKCHCLYMGGNDHADVSSGSPLTTFWYGISVACIGTDRVKALSAGVAAACAMAWSACCCSDWLPLHMRVHLDTVSYRPAQLVACDSYYGCCTSFKCHIPR